ncbi:MAG: flagellin FliC [Proteobacteria bacterium]|nr:flagellin FliC [Pseudomonadota bacterium]
MAIGILNNPAESFANDKITKSTNGLKKEFEKLSSGKRINSASDDAAGLAIAVALANEVKVGAQAARNISDASSHLSIAEGGLQTASEITTRLNELATQSANGTLSDTQRASLNNEFQALKGELDRISQSSEFNGNKIFGSSVAVQSGTDSSGNSQTNISVQNVDAQSLGIGSLDISTQASAQAAIDQTKSALDGISSNLGSIGAEQSALAAQYENLKNQQVINEEARSRIEDADIASSSANLVSEQIKQKAAIAVRVSATNLGNEQILKLLS